MLCHAQWRTHMRLAVQSGKMAPQQKQMFMHFNLKLRLLFAWLHFRNYRFCGELRVSAMYQGTRWRFLFLLLTLCF